VAELAAVQTRLLNNVAGSLKPGGRLVYAVCTLTRAETTAVADAFTAAHPEFERLSAQTLWPHEINANGMFIASWRRK
jgi:16S rRNA (cytosine967-C5)-methyltransferase